MKIKAVTWMVNFLLASILVIVTLQAPAFAQSADPATGDEVTDDSTETAAESSSKVVRVPLSGTAIIQSVNGLNISPAVFDTGRLDIGFSLTSKIVLSHVGEADADPIQINEATLFGVNAGEYFSGFSGFETLYPGDSLELDVEFTPTYPGKKSAGLKLVVEGSSVPHVIMINGAARFPLTSDLESTKDVQTFGAVFENQTSTKTITLENIAEESDAPDINITNVTWEGDTPEAFDVLFTPSTLNPGQSKNFTVKMTSNVPGVKTAIATFEHDGHNGPVEVVFEGEVKEPQAIPVSFGKSQLKGAALTHGTSLAFGPDNKLYASQMDGKILVYTVKRNGKNNYQATLQETINSIHNVKNHDDDGDVNNGEKSRLVTGILLTGSAAKPVIYAQSSDPRQGGGGSGADLNLDTNSGILHKLVKNGNNWTKYDLVRGLPRSEENHHGNGLVMMGNKLLLSQGGHTNMGAPSNNFAETPEYALSGAILEFDLGQLGNGTYDLPTLNDEDRAGTVDANDPFGGNNGKNQAILETNGPVEIYAPGYRNAYSLVLTKAGKLYTIDNGPNAGWGGKPPGNCSGDRADGGTTYKDALHHIKKKGHYGGHPNPVRGNKNVKFNNSNPQSPIKGGANPVECNYKIPKTQDGALTLFDKSTNGLAEYTASNFGGAMQGDLIATAFGKDLFRLQLNGAGTAVQSKSLLDGNLGQAPLGVTTRADNETFAGTIWVVDYAVNYITVLEPDDY